MKSPVSDIRREAVRNATRGFGWLFVLVVSLALAAVLAGCGPGNQAAPKPRPAPVKTQPSVPPAKPEKPAAKTAAVKEPELKPGPMIVVDQKGISFRWWTDKGRTTSMTAKASSFEGKKKTKIGVLLDFSAELYENGKPTTTMTAPRVVADTEHRILTATGGVVLKSLDKSTVIKAGWMKWTPSNNKVVGNGGVKVTSTMGGKDHYDMEGAAFVADTALQTLTIRNSAKGMIY